MRYVEILEALKQSKVASTQTRSRNAREQLAAANKKRTDAARKYQDQLQSAHAAASKARAELNSIQEAIELVEGRRSYALRDRNSVIIGWIEAVGRLLQAKDRTGTIIGWYDSRTDQTRDKSGSIVGSGDLLAALIMCRGS